MGGGWATVVEIVIVLWMAWLITTDVIYAAKGQMPPRKRIRMAEIAAGNADTRYGVKGWVRDLFDDALKAETERRREKAVDRKEQRAAVKQAAEVDVDPLGEHFETLPRETGPAPATSVPTDTGPGPVVDYDEVTRLERDATDAWQHDNWPGAIASLDELRDRYPDQYKRAHMHLYDPDNPHDRPIMEYHDLARERATLMDPHSDTELTIARTPESAHAEGGRIPDPPTDKPRRPKSGDRMTDEDGRIRVWVDDEWTPVCPICGEPMAYFDRDNENVRVCRRCGHREWAPRTKKTTNTDEPTATVIPMFPTNTSTEKETSMSEPVAEVTGLQSAIDYAEGVASAHAAHGAAEGFAGSLAQAEYGDGVLSAVAAAQEASANAGALWTAAAEKLKESNVVKEAYGMAPDAGHKQHVMAE